MNRSPFLAVKYHNPENQTFQHIPLKERVKNPYRNNRLEKINRSRNSIIIDTLNSVDILEIVKCNGVILEVSEGFFCQILRCVSYTDFVSDIFSRPDLQKNKGKTHSKHWIKRLLTQYLEVISDGMLTTNLYV